MALLRRKADKIEVLAGVELFAGLSKKELGELATHVTEITVPAGTKLVEEGDTGREAVVILEGRATVRRKGRKIAEVGEGDVIGEMSLVTRAPRNATVTADTDLVVLHLDARDFASVIDTYPKVALKVLETVSRRLVEAGGA